MQEPLVRLDHRLVFPRPERAWAEPDGLLAYGGDLSPERLVLAYSQGIFPWYSEGEPILWWSPSRRGVLELDEFRCSKNLARLARSGKYQVSLNRAFPRVIQACAGVPRGGDGTWITRQMIQAYIGLHEAGHAHSMEVWDGQVLVGGLYGVSLGRIFCGESMFHLRRDTSKLAMLHLVRHLRAAEFAFIDCQMQNPHLSRLGVQEIDRQQYLSRLREAVAQPPPAGYWQARALAAPGQAE